MQPVIEVSNLRKRYGSTLAVDDISLTVQPGEIFGILGPNGAGKSTAVETIVGLRQPDAGAVRVLGMDPQREHERLVQRIGIQLQHAALPDRLAVWEALDLFASFYARTTPWQPLLVAWGLAEKRNTLFANLSGGQKQRLFIALALVNDPEVVFLDELTTGLDPQARRATWELVQRIRSQGKTVILVTHFMDEAQFLCDRLAIIDAGRVIALDTPANLVRGLDGGSRVIFAANGATPLQALQALPGVSQVERSQGDVIVSGHGDSFVGDVVALLVASGAPFQNLRTEQADLEDVFMARTGRRLRD